MNALTNFFYVCVNTVMFIVAIGLAMILLRFSSQRETWFNENLRTHSSVSSEFADKDKMFTDPSIKNNVEGLTDHDYVEIGANDVFSNIVSTIEEMTVEEIMPIEKTEGGKEEKKDPVIQIQIGDGSGESKPEDAITQAQMLKIKVRDENALKQLREKIGNYNYHRRYGYDENLNLIQIDYTRSS